MRIGGIIDISTKDVPKKASMVIFTIGCNFQCSFCHNKSLLDEKSGKIISIGELVEMVKTNTLVSAVSITGGEPTLQEDLVDVCMAIKYLGKYVSIDTNGYLPNKLQKLLGYVNRVALDLKGPLNTQRLKELTRTIVDPSRIIDSFHLLNKQGIDFEIRTTYVENIMDPNDIQEIFAFLINNQFKGNFVLQQYQYSEGVGEEFKEKFQKPEHITLLNFLKPYRNLDLPFKIYLRDEIVGYSYIDDLTEET